MAKVFTVQGPSFSKSTVRGCAGWVAPETQFVVEKMRDLGVFGVGDLFEKCLTSLTPHLVEILSSKHSLFITF